MDVGSVLVTDGVYLSSVLFVFLFLFLLGIKCQTPQELCFTLPRLRNTGKYAMFKY
jgi:hypothetical protein